MMGIEVEKISLDEKKFQNFKNYHSINMPVIFLGGAGNNILLKFSKIFESKFQKNRNLINVTPIYMNTDEIIEGLYKNVYAIRVKGPVLNNHTDTGRNYNVGIRLYKEFIGKEKSDKKEKSKNSEEEDKEEKDENQAAKDLLYRLSKSDVLVLVSAVGGGFGTAFTYEILQTFIDLHLSKARLFEEKRIKYEFPSVYLYLIKPFNQEDSEINYEEFIKMIEDLKRDGFENKIHIKEIYNDTVLNDFDPSMKFTDYIDNINMKIANMIMDDIENICAKWDEAFTDLILESTKYGRKNIKTIFNECYLQTSQTIE